MRTTSTKAFGQSYQDATRARAPGLFVPPYAGITPCGSMTNLRAAPRSKSR